MPTPGEHKTFQARILEYAEAVGWTIVSREEAERRRGFDPPSPKGYGATSPDENRAKGWSLFFDDLLNAKVREFNPCYSETEGALLGQFPTSPRLRRTSRPLHTDIYGNPPSPGFDGTGREFLEHLPNRASSSTTKRRASAT